MSSVQLMTWCVSSVRMRLLLCVSSLLMQTHVATVCANTHQHTENCVSSVSMSTHVCVCVCGVVCLGICVCMLAQKISSPDCDHPPHSSERIYATGRTGPVSYGGGGGY